MAEARAKIEVSGLEFDLRGDPDWVSEQLEKVLELAYDVADLALSPSEEPAGDNGEDDGTGEDNDGSGSEDPDDSQEDPIASLSLPAFLAECGAIRDEERKLLAVAAWLHAKGNDRITVSEVRDTLAAAGERAIHNAAAVLVTAVANGLCKEDDGALFVTDAGRTALGLPPR